MSIALLLVAASAYPLASPSALWLSWGACATVLWSLGAIKMRLRYLIYLLLPLLSVVYIALTLIALGRSPAEAAAVWSHTPEFMLFLLGVLVGLSGIELGEWVFLLRRIPAVGQGLVAVILTLSTGVSSTLAAARRNVGAYRLSRPRVWLSGKGTPSSWAAGTRMLDRVELTVVILVEGVMAFTGVFQHWSTAQDDTTPVRYGPMRLHEVYDIAGVPEICELVFGREPISRDWASVIRRQMEQAGEDGRVLDLGCGSGRLTLWLARQGWKVDAVENNPFFAAHCRQRVEEEVAASFVRLLEQQFPPREITETYAVVICHQNVMLELINELGLDAAMHSLSRAVQAGGALLFDYPDAAAAPKVGSAHRLFDGVLGDGQNVVYEYSYEGGEGPTHAIELTLERWMGAARERSWGVYRLAIDVPREEALERSAAKHGLRFVESIRSAAHSFFPSDLTIRVAVKGA